MVEFSAEQIVEIIDDLQNNLKFKALSVQLNLKNYLKMLETSIFDSDAYKGDNPRNATNINIPTSVFYDLKMYETTSWLHDLMCQYNQYSFLIKLHNNHETIDRLEKGFKNFDKWSKILDIRLNITMVFDYNSIHNTVHELQLILTAAETGVYSFHLRSSDEKTNDPLVAIYNDYKILKDNINLIATQLYKKHILEHV